MRLRRSDCSLPGYRRRRAGKGFVYLDPTGARVSDPDVLARIRALVIPPAWTDVWICPWPNGHIQAIGTDARGRRQYRYHDDWRVQRDRQKYAHMLELAHALPGIRLAAAAHLEQPGMPREKVLGCAVRLLDLGFFRVGGEQYAEENGTFGLATMLKRHARVHAFEVVFDYPAKSGRHRVQSVVDPEVAAVVAELKQRRGGGRELLAFREGTRWVDVRSADINGYLRDVSGCEITAKDFRTWHATVLASVALAVSWQAASSPTRRKRAISRAVCEVSNYLGNTPTVCRTSYIDPRVIDLYRDGVTIRPALDHLGEEGWPVLATQGAVEAAVVDLLEKREDHRLAA